MAETKARQLNGSATIFVVNDVMAALSHYRDVLGFNVAFTYGEPTFYAGVELDEVIIHLQSAQHTKRLPGNGGIYIFAKDVDAIYDQIRSRGGAVEKPPQNYPYGMRDFDVHDPDGNQITFGAEVSG